ncbi:AMP-binding protein [Pseudochrobactrum sp. Wa41.01b-1]|nr:AMP-binding protein [Pseudochrobactrum sp. Wa41.01b-1]QYM73325.1 AMP-binding protein [Pseudochrobactrum sp. Wa41.01b-1]
MKVTEKLSLVKGATEHPLIEATIGQFFDETCLRYPDVDALISVHQNIRLTYAELRQKVDALACGLLRLGLKKGDRVAILSPNSAEWVLTQFATAKAGLILVNINPAYRLTELAFAISKVACRAIILSPRFKSSDYIAMLCELAPEIPVSDPYNLHTERFPQLRWVIRLGTDKTSGMINFDDLLVVPEVAELDALQQICAGLVANDPINIQFTSGTTGSPKGATLTHRNILNNGRFVGDAIRLQSRDRLCIPVPLYHCFGMVMGNLGCLTHGATMVYPTESFEPLAVLRAVQNEHCCALYGVPTMFISILDHPDFATFDVSSLRTGIMAGSPCPVEVMKRVIEHMHMKQITIAYGMTETSPVSFQSSVDDSLERRVSTVGRVQPHCEVKIIDNSGAIVPCGVSGELCTRGYLVMDGYWDDQRQTDEAVDCDGWMHSGDLATIDAEGYCNIVGRIKDIIIRGGENIYPREVEEFLFRHPAIRDVQIVGVPDRKYGEVVCAWIILRSNAALTAEDVRAFCEGQIAHYKIPHHVKFVDQFPMTVTGKIQKYIIRERMMQELGLEESRTA